MSKLTPEFREFLRLLNDKGVRYLLVGGFAVIAHGYVRTTRDLDLWITVDPTNAKTVAEAVEEFFGVEQDANVFMQPETIFRAGMEPNRLEIFTQIRGVDFDHCYERREEGEIDGIRVPLISLADLRTAKTASGRPQDLADLDNLSTE